MTNASSDSTKYGTGTPYDHKYKAGNLGDVLKHCALLAWVDSLPDGPRHLCDTHAGAGMHALVKGGEWTAGVGRIDALDTSAAPAAVQRYAAAVAKRRDADGGLYPGSPALLRATLRPGDRLTLCEIADEPRSRLEQFYADDDAVDVRSGDGLASLHALAAEVPTGLAAFIDPPFVSKNEWKLVAEAVLAVARRNPEVSLAVWYPIKSLMRPQVLAAAVREANVPAATVDLITAPLREKRRALNGSGLLFVRPPAGLMTNLAHCLPWLGEALAHTTSNEWTVNLRGWR